MYYINFYKANSDWKKVAGLSSKFINKTRTYRGNITFLLLILS